jgi:radical SAM/Cys-rich protein
MMDFENGTPEEGLKEMDASGIPSFSHTLTQHKLKLVREKVTTLQLNTGLLCNQACCHCHLSAGPDRKEIMGPDTIQHVVTLATQYRFEVIDVTGGAPELNPHIMDLIEALSPLTDKLMLRCNLTALTDGTRPQLIDLLKKKGVALVASLPSLNELQTNSQRGDSIFNKSMDALKMLNSIGYGQPVSGLELNLVSNPTGAFLPSDQVQTEKRFRNVLKSKYGITFNSLYIFGNAPLGRFKRWLKDSGNYIPYLKKLLSAFNPCAVDKLMCRTLISVAWDGYLYDCDFNLAAGIYMGRRKMHISELFAPSELGRPIAVAEHCYTCTAGSGFT